MQTEDGWVSAKLGAETAIAELHFRIAGLFFETRVSDLRALRAATFKHAKHIARLRNFPALNGLKIRQHAFGAGFFGRGRRIGLQPLRRSVRRVAFGKERVLLRKCAVVVKRSLPQHRAVRHHTGTHSLHLGGMAP